MNLTLYTDYSLRVLLYLGSKGEKPATITEISEAYGISRNHLVKVVHGLGKTDYIETVRGKGGGMRLSLPPDQIVIGDVVQKTEPHFHMVECFDEVNNGCILSASCSLKGVLGQAFQAFMQVLNDYTLADFLRSPEDFQKIFWHSPAADSNSKKT